MLANEFGDHLIVVDLDWLASSFPDLSDILPITQGGQKDVFGCKHRQHGRCVLKLIRPRPIAQQYLDRECEAVSRLRALAVPNIPEIHDVGTCTSPVGPVLWVLEEFVPGRDLSEILSDGPLGEDQLLALARDLLTTAVSAESLEIVHRDIKPKNIRIDTEGKAWLIDFGIARVLDLESITPTDAVSGPCTPGYSAPEQFRYDKREISGSSDLFAIGVVLYECARGANPFIEGARDRLEILHRVERDPLPRLGLEWDEDGKFCDLVMALTQKRPYQRPRRCKDALEWLDSIANETEGQ